MKLTTSRVKMELEELKTELSVVVQKMVELFNSGKTRTKQEREVYDSLRVESDAIVLKIKECTKNVI